MALSKEASLEILGWEQLPVTQVQGVIDSIAQLRFVAPCAELLEDALDFVCSAAEVAPTAGTFTWFMRFASHKALSLPACPVLPDGAGLQELAQDARLEEACQLLPLAVVLVAAPSLSPVALCGFVVPTKLLYVTMAATMGASAILFHRRHRDVVADRRVYNRASGALLASSVLHLALALFGGVPDPLALHAAHPSIAAHFLQDFVVSPILILNIGQVAGLSGSQMACTVLCSVCGTAGALGAAVAPAAAVQSWCIGASVLGAVAAGRMLESRSAMGSRVSSTNRIRAEVASEMLNFTWVLYPLCQSLGLLEVLSVDTQLLVMALLDVVSKVGTAHITLKSPQVVDAANEFFRREEEHMRAG